MKDLGKSKQNTVLNTEYISMFLLVYNYQT